MDVASWAAVPRVYADERAKLRLLGRPAGAEHPLNPAYKKPAAAAGKPGAVVAAAPPVASKPPPVPDDPLSGMLSMPPGRTRVSSDADPLGMMGSASPVAAGDDPLSGGGGSAAAVAAASAAAAAAAAAASASEAAASGGDGGSGPGRSSDLANWDVYKKKILRDFTVEGTLRLGASFMTDAVEFDESGGAAGKAVDLRAKSRLQQLEAAAEKGRAAAGGGAGTTDMSQSEYTAKIESMHSALQKAWANDEKVAALKMAIKCAKMLGDTRLPQFYPSMFVMLTEVLECFGDLVFQRIKTKADQYEPLKAGFTAEDVHDEAKETCRNWFFKTACIRDLLPRLYIEVALLRCYRFLSGAVELPRLLSRLGSIVRGLGDPLVAVYARCYLMRAGERAHRDVSPRSFTLAMSSGKGEDDEELEDHLRAPALSLLNDYLFSFQEFGTPKVKDKLAAVEGGYDAWLRAHLPAVQWVVRAVGRNASTETFTQVLHKYNAHCKAALVLKAIVRAFSGAHYGTKAGAMVALAKQASEGGGVTSVNLFEALGSAFATHPPPKDQRLPVLNEVWRVVARCDDLSSYVACAATWLDVLLRHYSEPEILVLLADLANHVSAASAAASAGDGESAKALEGIGRHLEHLFSALIAHAGGKGSGGAGLGVGGILTSEHLHKLLDTFKPARKVEICKEILAVVASHQSPTSNPILINTLFDMARSLHDSIDALSADGERRRIASLVCSFVGKIDFRKDLEQQLNLYVDCRAAFPNLDQVQELLVLSVAGLTMRAHLYMKGRHSKKTSAFAKACLAYCHVTAPSVGDIFRRLELMLHCGVVALANGCLPQTDTFLKAAISLVPDVPATEELDQSAGRKRVPGERRLADFLKKFLGLLVVVPGHPSHGPFYLVQGLLNAMPRFTGWVPASGLRTSVYIQLLPLLAAHEQRFLPYTVKGVESNDALYAGSADFLEALHELRGTVVHEVLAQLGAMKELANEDKAVGGRVAELAADLASTLVDGLGLRQDQVPAFAAKLIDLATKGKDSAAPAGRKYVDATVLRVRALALAAAKEMQSGNKALSKALSDLIAKTSPAPEPEQDVESV